MLFNKDVIIIIKDFIIIGFFYKAMEYERLVKRYIRTIFLHILALVVSTKVIFLAAIN